MRTAHVTPARLDALYRKISWRLLPLLMLGLTLSYLDRVNISFAKTQMQLGLGFNDAVYGFAASVFFLGYVLCEVPSNLLLMRVGARKTLARVLVLWGLTSAAMCLVRDATSFYVLRFLLGVFEAGFVPGVLFYLTRWYGDGPRGRVLSYALLSIPLAGLIGAPLSAWVLTDLSGVGQWAGWQWLFLLEGLPAVGLGVVAFYYLDDSPQHAAWLSDSERALLATQLPAPVTAAPDGASAALRDPRVYLMGFSYFCMISGMSALSFWLPSVLRAAGVRDVAAIAWYAALPYLFAIFAMLLLARHSDRSGERHGPSAAACLVAAISLALAACTLDHFVLALTALIVATAALYAGFSIFWTIPSGYLQPGAAAAGVALINSIGQLGGFFSPLLVGQLKTATGSMTAALQLLAALLVLGACALIGNRAGRAQVSA